MSYAKTLMSKLNCVGMGDGERGYSCCYACFFFFHIYNDRDRKTDTETKTVRKEGHFLFNDALNTFYLRLYGVRHMIKEHTDSERGNPLPPQCFYYMQHTNGKITHTTAFVTPVVEHWLEREIAQWVHHEGSIRRSIAP